MDSEVAWYMMGFMGMLGASAIDLLDLRNLWRTGALPRLGAAFWVAEAIRALTGGVLAVALGSAGHVTSLTGALFVGLATPSIIEKLSRSATRERDSVDATDSKVE